MRRWHFILIAILLCSCGRHTKVEWHEISQTEMAAIGNEPDAIGHAEWKDREYEVDCNIYLMPIVSYPTVSCYEAVVRHELRHCYEFDWHTGKHVEPECMTQEQYEYSLDQKEGAQE
jgi:hypothetical protein